MVKTNFNPLIKTTVDYLTRKEAWKYGFIKYSVIKKMIVYATKHNRLYIIRKVFVSLIDKGYIEKKRNVARSYMYRFINPNATKVIPKQITITFE